MGSQHIQMLRVALFAALTIVAFGDHGMTTTAAAEPDTTTTVAATTTTTAPIAGERRADAPFVVGAKNTNGEGCPDNYSVVAKVACTATKSYPIPNSDPYISYVGPSLFVPGDITACKPVACALNDLVGAFDPDCPVPTAAPAFTQITQTVVQAVPGVDARRAAMNVQYISAATFNADPNVKSAYQKAYGSMIGCTDTDSTTNAVTYKTGCSVDAYATDARRAAM